VVQRQRNLPDSTRLVFPQREQQNRHGIQGNKLVTATQAAYRGPRLYDSSKTLDLVKKWVSFYKKHRNILNSDIIHVKRADGRDIGAILHVNPRGMEKGLLMVYNPLDHPVRQILKVNVYYTGLGGKALITDSEGKTGRFQIDRDYNVSLPVKVEANSQSWYIMK
jgi:hypothetical protein